MNSAFIFGGCCLRRGAPSILRAIPRRQQCFSQWSRKHSLKDPRRRPRTLTAILVFAALSPAAFIQLSEVEIGDGKTGEEHMLEVSREEIRKKIPDNVRGLRRLGRSIVFILDQYVYEPIATSFRFLHLVIIFVPVIVTIPVIWFGRRKKDKDNERAGTLWWYGFLVSSMERAGPAFIKVTHPSTGKEHLLSICNPARTMGGV